MNIFKHTVLATMLVLLGMIGLLAHATDSTDALVQEFNQPALGIAFTMLSKNSWENPGHELFHTSPTTPQTRLQAVTLSNKTKKIKPYQGDTHYGLAFRINESSGFYRYFATKSRFTSACDAGKAVVVSPISQPPASQYSSVTNWGLNCGNPNEQIAFCGRCFDGGVCAGSGNIPNTPNHLWPALGDQLPFAEFQKAKNAIVVASGSSSTCRWATQDNIWNEFNTNGLSPTALVGVLVDDTTAAVPGSWVPTDTIMCTYLKSVNASRSDWPVYTLSFTQSSAAPSKLVKTRVLSCS